MEITSDRRTAGGKITRRRRAPASSRTPYSRPAKTPAAEDPESPNWLSGLILPAKVIASGAGKILSFFSPSSSSSSSSDGDSAANNDDDDDEEVSFRGYGQLDKMPSSSSKSDTKHAIEQLVIHETFSREEGNELIELVKSRIVDENGTIDENALDNRITAIMEARKWLQEKRSGSKKKLESEFDISKLATSSQFSRNEKGSPVDMAKSYMLNHPAWASPSLKHTEVGSLSPPAIQSYMQETPKSGLRRSELIRDSLTSGSWNILEEIRRVRSKATEELLAASPLTKIGLSSYSAQNNLPQNSATNNTNTLGADVAESSHAKTQDVLLDDAARLFSRDVNQDGDAILELQEQKAAELKSNEDNKVHDPRNMVAENGCSASISSLRAGGDATTNPKPSGQSNGDQVELNHDVHVAEPTTDVLTAGPSDSMVNGSQNSSSMQHEDLSQESDLPIVDHPYEARASDAQKGRKSRGYSRRSRGRAK